MVEDVIAVSVRLRALLLTHRAALERAADPKSRPIYSVLHGLSAGIFRLNFRSLDHRYGRGRDCSKRAFARTFADAPRGSGKSCRSKISTYLLSFARAIRWYLQIEFS